MKDKAFYRQLVRRYMENKATDEELEVFFHLLEQGRLETYITEYTERPAAPEAGRVRRMRRSIAWAAAVLGAALLAGGGIYLAQRPGGASPQPFAQGTTTVPAGEIAPGGDNALLTLADGSVIELDSAGNGSLSVQGNTTVYKHAGGKLAYQAAGPTAPHAPTQFNTLTTPRGGKYQVLLPDGTTVVLNAASSLRFPAAFAGAAREVELNGEAYFEVTKNAAMPFRVKLQGADRTVEVLGTSFNVMAYRDEPVIKTTLVTGAVKVKSEGAEALLKPGQQAVMSAVPSGRIKVENTGVEEAIAWTNNEFYFNNTNIYSIMRQISRWYNVDVSYEDSLQVFLNGNIRKNVNASQVFKMLELTGEVHFRTEGSRVIVSGRRR